ncbi:MAG: oligosaccharide flippase family protein, partial [Syntrophobacteraceae bacterium]
MAFRKAQTGKDDALFIASSSIKVLSSQAVLTAFSLAFNMYLARTLSTTLFALIMVYGIVNSVVRLLSDLGIYATLVQKVPGLISRGDKETAVGLMKFVLVNRLAFAGAASLAVAVSAGLISRLFLKTDAYALAILLMLPGSFFASVSDGLALNSQAIRRFGLTSLAKLAGGIALIVCSTTLYLFFGVKGYLIGLGLGPFLQTCVNFIGLRDFLFAKGKMPHWSKTLRYSFPFYLRALMLFALQESDRLITGILLPPAVFAGYGIARKFTDYINLYGESIETPMLIKLAETAGKPEQALISAYSKVARYGLMVIAPPCLAVACASPFLMTLFGGSRYSRYWPILTILAISRAAYFLSTLLGGMMVFVLGSPVKTLLMDAIPGIINPVASIVLISIFGQSGTAWSQIITFICATMVARCLLKKIIQTRISFSDFRIVFQSFLPAALIVFLAQTFFSSMPVIAVCLFFGALVFLTLHMIMMEDRDWAMAERIAPVFLMAPALKLKR